MDISSDTEIEPEPETQHITDLKEINDLVRQLESEANKHIHYVSQDCTRCANPI